MALAEGRFGALKHTQQNQVQILLGLARGEAVMTIARQLGCGGSSVCNFAKTVAKGGLGSFLSKLESKLAAVSASKVRKQRGRKGIDSLIKWWSDGALEEEPVLDIACLWLGPGQATVVFAFRSGNSTATSKPSATQVSRLLHRRVSLTEQEIPPWNEWNLCESRIAEILSMTKQVLQETPPRAKKHRSVVASKQVPMAFSHRWTLFALTCAKAPVPELTRWMKRGFVRAENMRSCSNADEFVAVFARFMSELRGIWTGSGLLPWLGLIHAKVIAWARVRQSPLFVWRQNESNILAMFKLRQIHWYYHAVLGGVFEIDAGMRLKLPWNDVFSLKSPPLRPRIEVQPDPENPGEIITTLSILPQLALQQRGPRIDHEPQATATRYRANLIGRRQRATENSADDAWKPPSNRTPRLTYSNRIERDLGRTLLEAMHFGESFEPVDSSCPCVLIPRHWVSKISPDPLLDLADQDRADIAPGASRKPLRIGGKLEPCIAFCAPQLLEGIRIAYRRNWYGDYLCDIYQSQKQLVDGLSAQDPSGFAPECFDFIRFKPSPYHWCPKRKRGIAAIRGDAAFHFESDPDLPRIRFSESKGFAHVLSELDADFLLLGVDLDRRWQLDLLTTAWSNLVRSVVAERISRMSMADAECQDATQRALVAFGENAKRASRDAIENAQRLLLAGKKPLALVVESEESLWKRWSAFRLEYIKGEHSSRSSLEAFGDTIDQIQSPEPEHDSSQILEAFEDVLKQPRDPHAAEVLASTVRESEFQAMEDAIERITENWRGGADLEKRLAQAFDTCRGHGPPEVIARQMQKVFAQPFWSTLFKKH